MDTQSWIEIIETDGYDVALQRAHGEATEIAVYTDEVERWADQAARDLLELLDLAERHGVYASSSATATDQHVTTDFGSGTNVVGGRFKLELRSS